MNTFPVKGAYINSLQAAYKKILLQTGAICSSKSVAMLRSNKEHEISGIICEMKCVEADKSRGREKNRER